MDELEQQDSIQSGAAISDARLGAYTIALLVFWAGIFAYTVHPILPANPIQLPFEENSPFVRILPQGWGFFTRDPRSMDLAAFVRTSDGLWHAAPSARGFWPHVLSFSRRWKMPGVEIGIVLNGVSDPSWQECSELPAVCLEKAPLSETIENTLTSPSLCGEVGIVRQPPIPWAWSQSPDEVVMPSEVLRLQVSCRE